MGADAIFYRIFLHAFCGKVSPRKNGVLTNLRVSHKYFPLSVNPASFLDFALAC